MEESGTSEQPKTAAAPEIDAAQESVVAQAGRLLVRNLGALLTPVTVISISLWVPGLAVVLMTLDGQAVIRNGAVQPVAPGPGLVVTSLVVVFALVMAHLVLVAMVAVMTADTLLHRPVSAGRALRGALRRSAQLFMLLVLTGVAPSALIALAAFTPVAERPWTFAALALTLAAVAACWLLLAVPIVVLYEAGPFRALARLWQITRRRRTMMFWHALATTIVVPIALGAIAGPPAWLLTGVNESIAETAIMTVLGVLTVTWQGIAVTMVTLNQRYPTPMRSQAVRPETLTLADLATRRAQTPSPRQRRLKRAAALTVLLMTMPGALYGGYLYVNPQSLPDITSRSMTWDGYDYELVLLSGDIPAVLAKKPRDKPIIQVCADRECHRVSTFGHPSFWDGPSAAAALPDGSMAITWAVPAYPKDAPNVVRLDRCTAHGCPPDPEKPRAIAEVDDYISAIAIAASGPAITVAILSSDDTEHAELRIVRCADISCASPRTLLTADLEISRETVDLESDKPLAMVIGAGGRPVVAYEDVANGGITLFSCYDADCRRPVRRQVFEARSPGSDRSRGTKDVEVVVPPDGRPVLLHRRTPDRTVELLRCRTPDCAGVDAVEIAGPRGLPSRPSGDPQELALGSLALGPDELPLIATHDFGKRKITLVACEVADCSRRHTMPLGETDSVHPPAQLEMVVSPDGRPRILRDELYHYEDSDTQLLTCRNIRCGA